MKIFYTQLSPISDRVLLFVKVLRRWFILPVRTTCRWWCL